MNTVTRRFVMMCVLCLSLFSVGSPAAAFGPAGNEFRVNTTLADNQMLPSIAMADNGNYVVVWEQIFNNSGQIYGQRYNAAGVAQGGEFQISSVGYYPEVAMDSAGNFVVVWQGSGGVTLRKYNAAGVAQGDPAIVGAVSSDTSHVVHIAMDPAGYFMVVWEKPDHTIYARSFNPNATPYADEVFIGIGFAPRAAMNFVGGAVVTWTSGTDVYARRYSITASTLGDEFLVGAGAWSSVASVDADGRFTIVWEGVDGDSSGVQARSYVSSGTPLTSAFVVNTTIAGGQRFPQVAIDNHGEVAIVWEDADTDNVYMRRFDSYGSALGNQTLVSDSHELQAAPTLAMDNNGNFIVSYMGGPSVNQLDVYARRFSEAIPPEFRLNTIIDMNQTFPDVAADDNGNFVAVWSSITVEDGDTGIAAQRYNAAGEKLGNQFTVNTTTPGSQLGAVIAMDADGDFVIAWQSPNINCNIFARRYSAAGVPQGSEFPVNTNAGGCIPAIAMDDSGNFVIVWERTSGGVHGQRYNAAGVAQGGEFRADTGTTAYYSNVAMDADGDFVVTWINSTLPTRVRARRYNSSGAPQGAEFAVNPVDFPQAGYIPAIGMDDDGNFVIAWDVGILSPASDDGYNIYAQRYDNNGSPQGAAFRVNTTTLNYQQRPDLDMNSSGEFVVLWETWNVANDDAEINAQRFSAAGVARGSEIQVNISTYLSQDYLAVAMDDVGNFVAVWVNQQSLNMTFNFDIFGRIVSDLPSNTAVTENEFYTAFEQERAAYPDIAQGIADFVSNGINMTVTLNTGEAGRVNFVVTNEDGIVTIQIASITTLSGGVASQTYINIINRDLPPLLTAALDNIALARFGAGHNVESIIIDSSTMTLTVSESQ